MAGDSAAAKALYDEARRRDPQGNQARYHMGLLVLGVLADQESHLPGAGGPHRALLGE